jgi:hypothetical protein
MNNLGFINYDEIESKIMMILMTNADKVYTKSELYSLLIDKFDVNSYCIDHQFKLRYMTVLNQLPSKYDVKVTNNLVSSGNETNVQNYEIRESNIYNSVSLPTMEEVSEFIVENNMQKQAGYDDLTTDLIKGNKMLMVEKLLQGNDHILFFKKDKENHTPLMKINSQQMSNLFLEKLYEKIITLEKENLELFDEVNKINDLNKVSFYQFFCKKLNLFMIKYNSDINFLLIVSVLLFLLFSNPKFLQLTTFFVLVFNIVDYSNNKIFGK